MPNLLALVQSVHKLAQIQGSIDAIASTGISAELAALVSRAWIDIQNLRDDFDFMRKVCTFFTQPTINTYAISPTLFPIEDDFGRWRIERNSFTITDPDSGIIKDVDYDGYDRLRFKMRTATAGPPRFWSSTPDLKYLILSPNPDKQYTANADYFRSPQTLSLPTDTPHIRASWHDIIIYKALSTFGMNKGLSALHQKYETAYAMREGELFRNFVPAKTITIRPAA